MSQCPAAIWQAACASLSWLVIRPVQESTMRKVGAFEARNTFGTLQDWVQQGEEVVITRRGKPIAKLVPLEAAMDRAKALSAVQRIRAMRKGVTPGGLNIRDLVDEGRR
jgi:prevent-host-death family protein